MSKSYVSMEQKQCIICGCLYDTNSILLDRTLKDSMETHTVTGSGMCPEHQTLKDSGLIALVEADEQTKNRSGRVAHVNAETWELLFDVPAPEQKVAFVEQGVMDHLIKISECKRTLGESH